MDGAPLEPEEFLAIARLPGLDALHGQLVGIAASPITGLVRGLASMVSGLAVALGQSSRRAWSGAPSKRRRPPPRSPLPTRSPSSDSEAEEGAPAEEAEEAPPAGEDPAADGEAAPGKSLLRLTTEDAEQDVQTAGHVGGDPAEDEAPGGDVQEETKKQE